MMRVNKGTKWKLVLSGIALGVLLGAYVANAHFNLREIPVTETAQWIFFEGLLLGLVIYSAALFFEALRNALEERVKIRGPVKWSYILVFNFDKDVITEEQLKQFDRDVTKRLDELTETHGVTYKLTPIIYDLVENFLRR